MQDTACITEYENNKLEGLASETAPNGRLSLRRPKLPLSCSASRRRRRSVR